MRNKEDMKKSLQFVVLAPNAWKGQWMNRQQLFSRIGKMYKVIYSTGPFMSWEVKSKRFSNANLLSGSEVSDNVIVHHCSKFSLRVPKLAPLDSLVKRHFKMQMKKHLFANHKTCFYVFHPKFNDYVDCFDENILVYHAYDDFSKEGGDTQTLENKEKQLLARADFIFASSRSIQKRLQRISDREDVHFVPNGVNFEMFSNKKEKPQDLLSFTRPVVSYTGSINRKVDLSLLCKLANRLTEVEFLMIGTIGDISNQEQEYADLKIMKNVHFLGFKSKNKIASYMQHVDINIMLYRTDNHTWASSVYPLKLHEYLAAGKPVIGSDIEALREFSDVVNIAIDEGDWINKIIQCIEHTETAEDVTKRKTVAKANTWEHRAETIVTFLEG